MNARLRLPTLHSPGSARSPGEACRMRAARRCNAPSPGSRPCHCVTGRLDGPRSPGVTSRVYHTRRAQRGTSERVDPSSTASSSLHYRPATTALGHAHRHERHGSSSPARSSVVRPAASSLALTSTHRRASPQLIAARQSRSISRFRIMHRTAPPSAPTRLDADTRTCPHTPAGGHTRRGSTS